jgi:hypothetical protein
MMSDPDAKDVEVAVDVVASAGEDHTVGVIAASENPSAAKNRLMLVSVSGCRLPVN